MMMSDPWSHLPLAGVLGFLLVRVILYAERKGRERRMGSGAALNAGEDARLTLPAVHWLDGEDSPTGRRVLDCRAYALGVQLVSNDRNATERRARLIESDGSELEGQSPPNAWLVDVDWRFDFEEAEAVAAGMRSKVAEDMWMIDCRGSRLYFRRSWTGQLVFMTNWERIPTEGASISRIWVPGEEPFGRQPADYLSAYVRHLIDTHLLDTLTPFPIPPDFPPDDQKIAAYVFHSVGRRGWLAEYFGVSGEAEKT